jgi:ribosomal protein S12 methylthiotransferase
MKVLIDRVEGDSYIGRTQYDSPEVDNEVIIPTSSGYLRVGDFADVRIHSAEHYDLHALPIDISNLS